MSEPKRIQRKRTKGWRMPEGAVYVGRPTKWGNPFQVVKLLCGCWEVRDDNDVTYLHVQPSGDQRHTPPITRQDAVSEAVRLYRLDVTEWLVNPPLIAMLPRLQGHDLACWCPIGQPCHADVLLELANPPI